MTTTVVLRPFDLRAGDVLDDGAVVTGAGWPKAVGYVWHVPTSTGARVWRLEDASRFATVTARREAQR